MAHCEVDSFVNKFKFLCSAGYKATLTIEASEGEAFVTLKTGLGHIVPPCPIKKSYCRRPSYQRRQEGAKQRELLLLQAILKLLYKKVMRMLLQKKLAMYWAQLRLTMERTRLNLLIKLKMTFHVKFVILEVIGQMDWQYT